MGKPPVIEMEVVPEEPGTGAQDSSPPGRAPVHPWSAVVLVAVDNLWMFADWNAMTWVVTIPLSFATVALPTFLIQRLVQRDPPIRAARWALLLGGLAAIPTSLFGTPLGLALLAWSGLDRLLGRPRPR